MLRLNRGGIRNVVLVSTHDSSNSRLVCERRLSKCFKRIYRGCINGSEGFFELAVFRDDCCHDVEDSRLDDDYAELRQ